MRCFVLLVALGLALGIGAGSRAAADPAPADSQVAATGAIIDLLESVAPVREPARPEQTRSTVARGRAVAGKLGSAVAGFATRPADRWRIPLPDGTTTVFRPRATRVVDDGVALLVGSAEGDSRTELNLATRGGVVVGTIRAQDGRLFRVAPRADGTHEVREVPDGSEPSCGNRSDDAPLPAGGPSLRALAAATPASVGPTNPAVVDVAFVFTRAAEEGAGGPDGMRALLALAVAEANDAYAHSAVALQLRSVCQTRTDYTESGDLSTDLSRLTNERDAWLAEVPALRDRFAADIVCLVVEWEASNTLAGMANQLRETSAAALAQGYTACLRPYLVGNYTLPHEVGHLLGCDHDRESSSGGGLQTWSYGTRILVDGEQYRTVMAYRPGRQFPYFSNPDVLFRGVPTGVATGSAAANNARTLNFTAPMVAGVRDPASRVGFPTADVRLGEASGTIRLPLVRRGTLGAAQVTVATVAASARDGIDFVGFRRTVALPAGSNVVEVPLTLLDNHAADGPRRLAVTLDTPSSGLALGPIGVLNVEIVDDEDQSAAPLDAWFRPVPGADYLVDALAADAEGRLVAGGAFATMNGVAHPRLARLLHDGSADGAFLPEVKYRIHALARLADGRIALGGDFNTVNATRLNHVALLRADGTLDPAFAFDPGTDLPVNAVAARPGSRLVIGGAFTNVQGTAALRVARLLPTGERDATFNTRTGPNDDVLCLTVDADERVIVGGAFRQVAGQTRAGVARLNANGTLDAGFAGGGDVDGLVRSVALDGTGRVLVAGDFTRFQGRAAGRLVRLATNGTRDPDFAIGAGAADAIHVVLPTADGRLWIAGRFRNFDGHPRCRVARLDANGALDPGFDPGSGPDDAVLALVPRAAGGVWIGGGFTAVNGVARGGVAALLETAPALPIFTGATATEDGYHWQATVAPGQSHVLERSSNLRDWTESGAVGAASGQAAGQVPRGEDPGTYLRLRRRLE